MPKYNLSSTQLDELIEQFVELQVDNLDTKTMVAWITDILANDYSKLTDSEFKERVDCYQDDLYDELVDNITEPVIINLPEGTNLTRVTRTGVELEDVDDSWYDENGGLKHD